VLHTHSGIFSDVFFTVSVLAKNLKLPKILTKIKKKLRKRINFLLQLKGGIFSSGWDWLVAGRVVGFF